MLAIKLAKTGKTNKKMFRVIISEKSRDPYGDVLEILGSYNPHSKELAVKTDRIKYWISKGAQLTATVNNLLVEKKIIEGQKQTASKKGQASEKRLAQIKAKADKKKAAEPAPAVAPVAEVPAETTPETPAA
jgi:small subunit ribosomal protein S16